mgnify:FL=1
MANQSQIREQVTAKIIAALERDLLPWRQMWTSSHQGQHRNAVSGRAYKGVNVLLLSIAAMEFGFQSAVWATFRQWNQMGCRIRRGECGTTLAVYIPINKQTEKPDDVHDDEEEATFWILKKFVVFNASQVVGVAAERFQGIGLPETDGPSDPDYEPAEELIRATGADIRYGGNRAFYSPSGDFICLPPRTSFSVGGFYSTVFHELAHWSQGRVDWDRAHGYAMGELIAELVAAFLSAELGIPNSEPLDNHASYLKHWLNEMRNDSNYIFKASRQASKVCDFLLSFVKPADTNAQPELIEAA